MNTLTQTPARSRFALPAIALGMLLCGLCSTTATAQEPILGTWAWDSNQQEFTLQPDGTAVQAGRTGTWVCVNATANPRVYQINWSKGLILDTLYLVQGGSQLMGQDRTSYNLHATRVATAPAPVESVVSTVAQPDYLDQLSEQIPRAREWVLAPLDTPVPTAVRQIFDTIDAALVNEAASVPPAYLDIYRNGWGIWRTLMAELHERDAWLRRNYELTHGGALPEAWKIAWAERTRSMESTYAASFAGFHEAVRLHPRAFGAGVGWPERRFAGPAGVSGVALNGRQEAERVAAAQDTFHPEHIAQGPSGRAHVSHAGGHRGRAVHGHAARIR